MGRYSYSQPSQSEDFGGDGEDSEYSEVEALIQMDQAELSNVNDDELLRYMEGEEKVYPPQPEVEFGFPQICYCGSQPQIATCYRATDPGRRFFTCGNKDDGDCHVWKWWDDAVMEEMRALAGETLQLTQKVDSLNFSSDNETEEKLLRIEKMVEELAKKNSGISFENFVVVMVIVFIFLGIGLLFI